MAIHFQGEIVLVQIPDPDWNPCAVPHNAVIVTKTESIDSRDFVHVVGITGSFDEPLPAHWIKLPYSNGGHVKTGLSKPCVAKCNWVVPVQKIEIIRHVGALHAIRLNQIIEAIRRLRSTSEPQA